MLVNTNMWLVRFLTFHVLIKAAFAQPNANSSFVGQQPPGFEFNQAVHAAVLCFNQIQMSRNSTVQNGIVSSLESIVLQPNASVSNLVLSPKGIYLYGNNTVNKGVFFEKPVQLNWDPQIFPGFLSYIDRMVLDVTYASSQATNYYKHYSKNYKRLQDPTDDTVLEPGLYTTEGDYMANHTIWFNGSSTDTWIIQINGDLVINASIMLSDDVMPSNIQWIITGSFDCLEYTVCNGLFMAQSITVGQGSIINGHLFSLKGRCLLKTGSSIISEVPMVSPTCPPFISSYSPTMRVTLSPSSKPPSRASNVPSVRPNQNPTSKPPSRSSNVPSVRPNQNEHGPTSTPTASSHNPVSTQHPTSTSPFSQNPTTDSPMTEHPTTSSPYSQNPTKSPTSGPSTSTPISSSPITENPTSDSPTTEHPTSDSPTTEHPTSDSPLSQSPTSANPVSHSPTSRGPMTVHPTSASPLSQNPTMTSKSPVSQNPTSRGPVTAHPTSASPLSQTPTNGPVQKTPTGASPLTNMATTDSPLTVHPTTSSPFSQTPTSGSPVTDNPSKKTEHPTSYSPSKQTPPDDYYETDHECKCDCTNCP